MKDLVSIITPTYNSADFIESTILSVISQTYQNWELIISDDCSRDKTREVIDPYLKADKRIQYICNKNNSGAAITRNNALKVAKGRWIAFLDSDDLWTPHKLENQIRFMEVNNYSFSYTAYSEIDDKSKPLGRMIIGPAKITEHGMFNYCWPGCLTVMYDVNVIGLIQIPDIKKNNDYAMWLKVIKKADCYFLDENLARYRKHEGSISNHSYVSLIKWHYRLFRECEGLTSLSASFHTVINLFFGVIKKLFYVKNKSL